MKIQYNTVIPHLITCIKHQISDRINKQKILIAYFNPRQELKKNKTP